MTAEQIDLLKQFARDLLERKAAGKRCDPAGLRWAKQLLKASPKPYVATPDISDISDISPNQPERQ